MSAGSKRGLDESGDLAAAERAEPLAQQEAAVGSSHDHADANADDIHVSYKFPLACKSMLEVRVGWL